MLPAHLPQQHFVCLGTRPVRDDEQQWARETMCLFPRRIWRACLLAIVMWPICIGPLIGLDALFGPGDESWLEVVLELPFFIGILALPAVVICLGFDIREDWNDALFVLSAALIEMWQRHPPEEFDDEEKAYDFPCFVEVIAGTDKIWDEERDDFEEEWDDEEDDAQLSRPSDS